MDTIRLRRSLALVASAALLASLTAATVAAPTSAADAKCRGADATITGTPGDDVILGTNGRDVIAALAGDDIVKGRGGNDLICGGLGDDRLVGNRGLDRLYGNGGGDRLFGGAGPDLLFGGVGDDLLVGRAGNDGLDGGPGTDRCYQNQGSGPRVNCELPVAKAAPNAPMLIDLDAKGILAVAYSDIDGLDGYSTGDVLIAKLVDTDPGGVPSVGDTIMMGRYPTDFNASAFAAWTVKSHTVTIVRDLLASAVSVGTTNGAASHAWAASGAEIYGEGEFGGGPGAPSTTFVDWRGGGRTDFLGVHPGSPSSPQTSVPDTDGGAINSDAAFIDVELNYTVP